MESDQRLTVSDIRTRLADIAGRIGLEGLIGSTTPPLDEHFPPSYWDRVEEFAIHYRTRPRPIAVDQDRNFGGGFPFPEYQIRALGLTEEDFITK